MMMILYVLDCVVVVVRCTGTEATAAAEGRNPNKLCIDDGEYEKLHWNCNRTCFCRAFCSLCSHCLQLELSTQSIVLEQTIFCWLSLYSETPELLSGSLKVRYVRVVMSGLTLAIILVSISKSHYRICDKVWRYFTRHTNGMHAWLGVQKWTNSKKSSAT